MLKISLLDIWDTFRSQQLYKTKDKKKLKIFVTTSKYIILNESIKIMIRLASTTIRHGKFSNFYAITFQRKQK